MNVIEIINVNALNDIQEILDKKIIMLRYYSKLHLSGNSYPFKMLLIQFDRENSLPSFDL